MFDTTMFPIGTLFIYWAANVLGFMYVQMSNLNYYRDSLFLSRRMTKRDFYYTIAFAPIFYFVSSIMVLRSQHDCSSSPCSPHFHPHRSCVNKPYTFNQVFFYNLCVWGTAYTLGL